MLMDVSKRLIISATPSHPLSFLLLICTYSFLLQQPPPSFPLFFGLIFLKKLLFYILWSPGIVHILEVVLEREIYG